jgi:hypothetical protein
MIMIMKYQFTEMYVTLICKFWPWYINITITFPDIIYHPVFYNVSGTESCHLIQVELTQLGLTVSRSRD